jgi:hypothetical protein
MDTENQAKTITGSLVQPTSPQSYVPSDDEHKLQLLIRLGSHFWPRDFTPSQAKHLLIDYLEDLKSYRVAEIEHFCRDWRTDVSKKNFPKVGEVITAIDRARRELAEAARAQNRPKIVSRPIRWWSQAKQLWKPEWLESEVPAGEKVRDTVGGPWRWPEGVSGEKGGSGPF